jgi:hypothetical protein
MCEMKRKQRVNHGFDDPWVPPFLEDKPFKTLLNQAIFHLSNLLFRIEIFSSIRVLYNIKRLRKIVR